MANGVLTVLSVTLGLFFIFVGTLKITPAISNDLYKDMRKTYIRSAKVFPLVKQTGWKPNPHMYRKAIGTSEIVCGAILAAIPGHLKEVANVVLVFLMLQDIYTHYSLDEGMERMSLPIVFALLLTCRIIVNLQIKSRQLDEANAMGKKVEQERLREEKKGQ